MGCCFRVVLIIFVVMGGFVCELGHGPGLSHEAHLADLLSKAKALRGEGSFEESVRFISKALKAARDHNMISLRRDCFLELGILFWNLGRHHDAENCFREALYDSNNVKIYLDVMSLHSEGARSHNKGEHENAVEAFRKGIELSRKIPAPEFEVKLKRLKGEAYRALNDLEKDYLFNEKALRLARALRHRGEEAKSLKNLGIYYRKMSRHEKALESFEKSLKLFHDSKEHEEVVDCLKSIGDLYAEWGDFDKSLSYLYQALGQSNPQLSPAVYAEHLLNIGLTYRKKWVHYRNIRDLFLALAYCQRALQTEGLDNHGRLILSALTATGVISIDIGQYEVALETLRNAEAQAAAHGYHDMLVRLTNQKGRALMKMGHVDEALTNYMRALNLAEARGMDAMSWESHTGIAECYRIKKNSEKSLEHYARAMTIIENVRSQIPVDIFKAGFSRDKMKAYHGVIELFFEDLSTNPETGCSAELFLSVEKAKARALLESLSEERPDLCDRMRRRELDISSRIASISHSLSVSAPPSSAHQELKDQLLRAEEEYLRWVSKTRASSRPAVFTSYQDAVSLSRIQTELLDDRTALVEYFLGDQRSLVFFVTRRSCRVFSLPPRRIMEKRLRGYMKLIAQLPEGPVSIHRASERLAEELLFPGIGDQEYENIDTLIIVPDGVLHLFPFESLLMPQSDPSTYLIERFRVSYASSASALLVLRRSGYPARHGKMMLAFGNPDYGDGDFQSLPYSRKEIAAISKIFPNRQIDVFQGKKANKTVLKSLDLTDYRILHFACHGYVDEKFPIRSALVLSPRGKDDNGLLQFRDIYAMRISAELVVLSACQSGRGRIEYSEGIIGLPHIFFTAGARSVVSSLWTIRDDATAIFMKFFYEFLSEGVGKSQALRSAKLKMLSTRFSHPHYWAAFVLHGDFSSPVIGSGL